MKRYDVESAKDLIFIPCHLNNAQKIDRVKELIEHYSKFGFILLGSHYKIPESVSQMADFCFYDKNNPMIGVHEKYKNGSKIYHWQKSHGMVLIKNIPYHGYAHLLLVKTAYNLSLGWNFKRFHHISYDIPLSFCNISKIKEHNFLLNTFDGVFYLWYNTPGKYESTLFSFNTNIKINSFANMKTFDEWEQQGFGFSGEQFMFHSFKHCNNYVYGAEDRIDDLDSVETIDSKNVTYQHPYSSKDIAPVLFFDDGSYYKMYFKNKTEQTHNIKIELNNQCIKDFILQANEDIFELICPNTYKDMILTFIVNDKPRNIFDISKEYNHADMFLPGHPEYDLR